MTGTSARAPLIGLTTYRQPATWGSWERPAAILQAAYVDCVADAGGRPVLLPPAEGPGVTAGSAESLAGNLDALVLVGGADLDPARYGAERDDSTGDPHPWRDENEISLLASFLDASRPVLGICRGTQLINTFLGGTLHQHLPDLTGSKDHQPLPGEFGEVRVNSEPGSRVAAVMGQAFEVACSHHQAIDKLGAGLVVTARSDDGVVEAVELGTGFLVGVQWHPEQKADTRLFRRSRRGLLSVAAGVLSLVNPATAEPLAEVETVGIAETDEAVARARSAFEPWAAIAPADRARLIRRFAEQVEQNAEELALTETRNVGKPISDSRAEVSMVAEVLWFYAGAVDKHRGSTIPVSGGLSATFHEPLGVVAAIVPWNFPLLIASWKIGPALCCGNTVVVKPATLTPLSTMRLCELATEAGIPDGVLQAVVGPGQTVGTRLVEHPDVAKVAFTGSTEAGADVMRRAAAGIKRVTLELGGKAANVVFADADLDRAAERAPSAVFGNAGQDCCARSRVLVEKSAYDSFVGLLTDAASRLRVGDPEDPETEMGPLVSKEHRDLVSSFVDPPEKGAEVFHAAPVPRGPGWWYPPTVVTTDDPDLRVSREEVFGPVVVVLPFDDEEDAARMANDTLYGLSGSIWTRDSARALRMSRKVMAGVLSVNSNTSVRVGSPFGGMKQSGLGRELGLEALDSFSELKSVFYSTE